jgi:hypothetical protein
VISRAKFRWFFQALLISAVMLAPVWGQIHKIVHGPALLHNLSNDQAHDYAHDSADDHDAEHGLFNDHEEGLSLIHI